MKKYRILALISVLLLLSSCQSKKSEYDPYAIPNTPAKPKVSKSSFEISFKKTEGNLKTVHIKLNGTNGYDAIFDTGCSGMLISSLELIDLLKSKTLTQDDYLGETVSSIADGTVIKNDVYNIREITITDKNGQSHTLRDIKATVVDNPGAEILIGSSVIDNLAKKSYTVDLEKKVIRFQ